MLSRLPLLLPGFCSARNATVLPSLLSGLGTPLGSGCYKDEENHASETQGSGSSRAGFVLNFGLPHAACPALPIFPPSNTRGLATSPSPTEIVRKRLGQHLEGFNFQVPNSPFDKSRLGPAIPRMVLYKGRWMLLFRFLVRAKVFQLVGVFSGAILLTALLSGTRDMAGRDVGMMLAVMVGCIISSYCIWYYSGRYVGEMSLLLPEKRVARFSTLDFWGNRFDADIPVDKILPPFKNRSIADVKRLAGHILMVMEVEGGKQYFISVRHGHLLQKDVLQKICYGSWLPELDKAPTQKQSPTSHLQEKEEQSKKP